MSTHNHSASNDKCLTQPKNIAILGGSFDPIHLGHINIAKQTAKWLGVKTITLLPAYLSPHKANSHASAEHRQGMLARLINEDNFFSLDTREVTKQSPSYSVDTLQAYRYEYPEHRIFFIIGMDSLLSFTRWHRWQDILKVANLVVNVRPGYSQQELSIECQAKLSHFFKQGSPLNSKEQAGGIYFHQQPVVDISSSELRNKLANGDKCEQWLATEIIDYIKEHQLYQ